MPVEEFHKYYAVTTICKVRDNYTFSSVNIPNNGDTAWVQFTIGSKGEGHVSIVQQNPRKFKKSQNYQIQDGEVQIFDSRQKSLLNTTFNGFQCFDYDNDFAAGTYYVSV